MSKRLLTAYAMTAMFLLGGLVRQAAAQFSAPRCPAEKFTPVREQTTGSLIFGVGVNSDAGLTGSIVLNERKLDVTRSCEQDADVSVEVRLISLSATYYERLSKDILRKLVAGGEQPLSPGDAPSRVRFAFLNDAQVNRLLDVTQADPRTKVRQTPKNALGNGQVSTLGIMEQHFFLTGAYATTKGDQVVLLPHNEPLSTGLQLCMQPTVSTDRRSVRLKLKASQTELSSAKVRQFPVTVPITPVFEGGALGAPVPFTQFIQQPDFITVSMEREVNIPDGSTLLLSGWAKVPTLQDEEEPSALSGLPLIGWLFEKPADPPEEKQVLVLVTPRIIRDE